MNKSSVEQIAKAIRHKACEIILEVVAENPTSTAAEVAQIAQARIMNIQTTETVAESGNLGYELERYVKTQSTIRRAADRGIEVDRLGSWDCDSADGVGLCVLDSHDDCVFCGNPDERK